MNWENINLKDGFERSQNILDGYSFDGLLLEISTNLTDINKTTITAYFEEQIKLKMRCAREIFKDNLENILADAIEYQNLDEEPNKPTSEEWTNTMQSLKENIGTPQEIKIKGEYYFDYFLEVLPPLMFSNKYVLCSEPYSHNSEGKGIFTGIYKRENKFFGVMTTKENFINLLKQ